MFKSFKLFRNGIDWVWFAVNYGNYVAPAGFQLQVNNVKRVLRTRLSILKQLEQSRFRPLKRC